MVFELSSEQRDFQTALRRFFERENSASYLRSSIEDPRKDHRAFITGYQAIGLGQVFGAAESARESFAELLLFARECGRALSPVHILEMLIAGPLFFSTFLPGEQRAAVDQKFGKDTVSGIIAEKKRTVRSPLFYQGTSIVEVKSNNNELTISGDLRLVPFIDGTSFLIHQEGDCAYMIALDQGSAVTVAPEAVLDLTHPRVRITLQSATAYALSVNDAEIYQALNYGLVAAEILGATEYVFQITSEYLKTRRQFGVPVGSFQAVQHALSDMYLSIEMLDSLVSYLAWALIHSPAQRELASQSAVRIALRDSIGVVEKAIQLHGGIGFTWEHDLHLYLRRVRGLCALVGDLTRHDDALLTRLSMVDTVPG